MKLLVTFLSARPNASECDTLLDNSMIYLMNNNENEITSDNFDNMSLCK